jgi:hypothetical protein
MSNETTTRRPGYCEHPLHNAKWATSNRLHYRHPACQGFWYKLTDREQRAIAMASYTAEAEEEADDEDKDS